ncbi:MAG: hypothetical protein RL129_97 [Actinomycetota bacterium]|jgi:nucleoside-diphosphate-sugar epimerase
MDIFITGGAGYVGTRLVPELLKLGHHVVVFDSFYYGNFLPFGNANLDLVVGDLRDKELLKKSIPIGATVLHLACISNDASFALDPELSKTINYESLEGLLEACRARKIKRFIFASTSSVYGVSEAKEITEDHPLKPITQYNEYKALSEPLILNEKNNFEVTIFRPATVCGYSPRMRFDLSVNILTGHAISKRKITVFGGEQLRPNLHIQDYIDLVKLLLQSNDCLNEIYNVGNQNLSLIEIANSVKNALVDLDTGYEEIEIVRTQSDDIRSYHINSDKIRHDLGFVPKYSIFDAVQEILYAFKTKRISHHIDDDIYHNVKRLKAMNVK